MTLRENVRPASLSSNSWVVAVEPGYYRPFQSWGVHNYRRQNSHTALLPWIPTATASGFHMAAEWWQAHFTFQRLIKFWNTGLSCFCVVYEYKCDCILIYGFYFSYRYFVIRVCCYYNFLYIYCTYEDYILWNLFMPSLHKDTIVLTQTS